MVTNSHNRFGNIVSDQFLKQIENTPTHIITSGTTAALDTLFNEYDHTYDIPSTDTPSRNSSAQFSELYSHVFKTYTQFCSVRPHSECKTTFRVIDRAQDAQLYLNVYRKYSRVSGKAPYVYRKKDSPGLPHTVRDDIHTSEEQHRRQTHENTTGTQNLLHDAASNSPGLLHTVCDDIHTSEDQHRRQARENTTGTHTLLHDAASNSPGLSNRGSPSQNPRRNTTRRRRNTHFAIRNHTTVDSSTASCKYNDFGDPNQRCQHCGASFWYVERLKGRGGCQYTLCCGGGAIYMHPPHEPPEYIKNLFENKHFIENIRAYNQMFAMTSFGAKIDESINDGRGPYVFKISGQIYHWIGFLCPPPGEAPRFLQLYIYDTDNEVHNRMQHFGGIDNSQLDPEIVQGLIHFLDAYNELVQLFRTARDKCREIDIPEFKIRLYNVEGVKGYEFPVRNTLGAMVFEDCATTNTDFDVIIEPKGGPPQRVNKLHRSYMALQFPLLFVYGESGYHPKLLLKSANGNDEGKKVTMLAYYRYQLHFRLEQYDLLFRGGRLFQQYVVSAFCAVEQSRLDFIRKKQNDIRSDHLAGLYDAISRGERDGYEVGGRIILPMSFTGGPRYMYAHYLDALAICRKLGNPQFFITFTCNVNWPEISRFMSNYPHLTTSDRADVVCRVFQRKIEALLVFLKDNQTFGNVTGVLYTVEFQKRGLPHCHTLLWIDSASKVKVADDIDAFISAEIPDPRVDREGYDVVSELMTHGPCGDINPKASCMKNNRCSKKFPKKFNNKTFFDENGHVHYRRRDTGISIPRKEFALDNSYVVPYNRDLLLAFQAHINVEYCGWSMLIKYLFKYISKGTDRIFARVSHVAGDSATEGVASRHTIDEIQNYTEGRFICAHEAYWRILKFDIHHREPAVQILAVHLQNMQRITFKDADKLESVVNLPDKKKTTLTEWFTFNTTNEIGRHLSYLEFPSEFVWYADRKSWSPRKTSKSSIGRLAYVHPASGELFFLRMLLCHQKGCRDFWEVQTVHGVLYSTYRAACEALGLLGDDKEWEVALEEACGSATPEELRTLFSHMLLYCDITDPCKLWGKYWKEMSHDIPRKVADKVQLPDYHLDDESLQGYILYEIEIVLNNCSKSLQQFGLPLPPKNLVAQLANRLLMEERNYDREELAQLSNEAIPLLNSDQKKYTI